MELKAVILRLQTKVRRYRRDLKLFSYKFKDATAEMKRQIAVHKAREMAEKAEKKAIKANKKAEQKQAQEDAPTRSKKGYARIDPVDLAHQLDEMDPATREEFYNKLALQINEWVSSEPSQTSQAFETQHCRKQRIFICSHTDMRIGAQ